MKTLAEVQQILSTQKHLFREAYRVTEIGIFGSYARGEQTEASDIDVLIDYEQAPTLLKISELRRLLSELVDMDVDIVTKNGLKPRIRERVLAEVIYL